MVILKKDVPWWDWCLRAGSRGSISSRVTGRRAAPSSLPGGPLTTPPPSATSSTHHWLESPWFLQINGVDIYKIHVFFQGILTLSNSRSVQGFLEIQGAVRTLTVILSLSCVHLFLNWKMPWEIVCKSKISIYIVTGRRFYNLYDIYLVLGFFYITGWTKFVSERLHSSSIFQSRFNNKYKFLKIVHGEIQI